MNTPVVTLEHIRVRFGDVTVLDDISLNIEAREFVGITGPNGGGKTTLLKVILGLISPEKGRVSVFSMPPVPARKRVGYVPQFHHFNSSFPASVMDVVLTGRLDSGSMFGRFSRADRRADRHAAEHALERVALHDLKNRQISKLSGGQQQRALIARALVSDPDMLLLDEPAASIDSSSKSTFYSLLDKLRGEKTIIMVTHDVSAVTSRADKILCLNRIFCSNDSDGILAEHPETTHPQASQPKITHPAT